MKTIILSGFGTFGNYPANTSEIVARALHAHTLGNYCVRSEIFPATIPSNNRAQLLREKARWTTIRGDKVHAIVSLGMSSSARGLTIETLAQNRVDDTRYCTLDQIGTSRAADNLVQLHSWDVGGFGVRRDLHRLQVGARDDVRHLVETKVVVGVDVVARHVLAGEVGARDAPPRGWGSAPMRRTRAVGARGGIGGGRRWGRWWGFVGGGVGFTGRGYGCPAARTTRARAFFVRAAPLR